MAPSLLPFTVAITTKAIKHGHKSGPVAVAGASAFLCEDVDVAKESPEERAARKAAKAARKAAKAAAAAAAQEGAGGAGGVVSEKPGKHAAVTKPAKRARPADTEGAEPAAKVSKVELMSSEAYRAAHEIKVRNLHAKVSGGRQSAHTSTKCAPLPLSCVLQVTGGGDGSSVAFIQRFEDAPFPAPLLQALSKAGFTSPTPIQGVSWPIALQKRDLVAVAKTGSGKTCGFLLPAFVRLKAPGPKPERALSAQGFFVSEPCTPRACVLAPTRELAQQIADEALRFAQPLGFAVVCLYGGCDKAPQLHAMRAGCDLVIATPGRLNDFLEPPSGRTPPIAARCVEFLVLDEADRMLDMGFEPQIRQILRQCPHTSKGRQTLLFTATWPKEVSALAASLTASNAAHIRIGDNGTKLVVNTSVKQHVEVLASEAAKGTRLASLLRQRMQKGSSTHERCIVFCATKRKCEQTAIALRTAGFPVAGAIHGDKTQQEREMALSRLKDGSRPILVATDVAARGLDIQGVTLVVVYDLGREIADYVHRVGRTGRAGATGDAYTFLTEADAPLARPLKALLGPGSETTPAFDLLCNSAKANRGGGGLRGRQFGGRGGGGRGGRGGRGGGRFSQGRGRKW